MGEDFYSIRRIFDESILEHRAKVEVFIEQYIQSKLPMASYSQYSKTNVESMLRELSNRVMEITRESVHKMQIKASKRIGSIISGTQGATSDRVSDLEADLAQTRSENEHLSSQVRVLEAKIQEKELQIDEYISKFKEVEVLLQAVAEKDYDNVIESLTQSLNQMQEEYKAFQDRYQNEKDQWELKFLEQAKRIEGLGGESPSEE